MNEDLRAELEEMLRSTMFDQAFETGNSLNEEQRERLSKRKQEYGAQQVFIWLAELATSMEHPLAECLWGIAGMPPPNPSL